MPLEKVILVEKLNDATTYKLCPFHLISNGLSLEQFSQEIHNNLRTVKLESEKDEKNECGSLGNLTGIWK
jgi:hypothetical protein